MAKIDIDKFVASLIKYYYEVHNIDRRTTRCWFDGALEEQGLEYKNGEIVKTQRRVAAEAKEAIFDDEDEKSKKWILEYLYDGLRKSDEQFKDQFKAAIDWVEKQNSKLNLDELCDWLRKNVSNYTNGEYNEFHHQYEYNGTIDIDGLIKELKSYFS